MSLQSHGRDASLMANRLLVKTPPPLPKWHQDKNGPSKVETTSSLLTNDTSVFSNSTCHLVIMHAYEVQMDYVSTWYVRSCKDS